MLTFILTIVSFIISAMHFVATANVVFQAIIHLGVGGFIVGFFLSKNKFQYFSGEALTLAELVFHLIV